MRTHGKLWAAGVMCVLVGLAACQQKVVLDTASADAWAKVIVGHTSGVVSRKAEVRVLFSGDVTAVKALTSATLQLQPAVQGQVVLRGARELVLTPAADLKPGQEYQVTLSADALGGLPKGIKPYQFSFHVQTPQYDVTVAELESDPADDRRMILRGSVVTADTEDAAAVERMLAPNYAVAVQTSWAHASDGRSHQFTLAGLLRQAEAATLRMAFDGRPIGSGRSDEREVRVPAVAEFSVVSAAAQEAEGRKEIRVIFSDSLEERQDLKGLVQLSAGEFTTRVDGNILTIYPAGEIGGDVTVTLEPGIRNAKGRALAAQSVQSVTLVSEKPQVRFVGNGVILPDGKALTVPFEAVSARSVRVVATRVYPENIGQFLQVNALGGQEEIGRVGRYLWRKTIPLTGPITGRWRRFDLDVTELMRKYPGSLFQLSLQITPADSAYACAGTTGTTAPAGNEPALADQEDGDQSMPSSWDFAEDYFGVAEDEDGNYDYQTRWRERTDPCKPAYYTYTESTRAQRNVLASNIGLLAKADQRGKLLITATDLRTAQPKAGVALSLRNFQGQVIVQGTTDNNGMATLEPAGTPFLLVGEASGQRSYLKMNAGVALPVSHFDVGGETVSKGLKGSIYGERGVWRPGDPILLTFVLRDREKTLPANHPATLELLDPRGRSVQTMVNNTPKDGFYRFDARTSADAPTGNWTARVTLGGVIFRKTLKVETVMPNRLKIVLDLGDAVLGGGAPVRGKVQSEWLSGASAAGLKSDLAVRLVPTTTTFARFTDYVFDDPAREFSTEPQTLFEGPIGEKGEVAFDQEVELSAQPPGMLNASFTTRVFEPGGAFSINHESRVFAPYQRFVGLRLPKGDVARGMLRTDEDHVVEIGSLTAQGAPVAVRKVKVTLYKVEWRWWWSREQESLAQYVARESSARVSEETVATNAEGRAQWKLRVNYPQWGRYLLRVCDEDGGHCAGSTFYIDWPAWAGKQRDQTGPAATMLSLTTDKSAYQVGETAVVQLPESAQGRALVTVENGSGILDARWVVPSAQNTRVSIPITAAMTPNVYVAVTLVQPHEGKANDLPIRLYGVVPLEVSDPQTHLKPVLTAADEWRPESKVSVKVGEAAGKPMTYTLAVVDEGLLSLTSYKTPDLHREFFRREALGVRTWDLFDEVIGAYGSELERLLALGGSDGGAQGDDKKSQSRFPPVAQVLGPFELKAGETHTQSITLPRYVGAVRVMVVAGSNASTPAAFGSVEKSVYVRQPLMILPTMPRVVGPGEEIAVPVSVFAMHDSVRDVALLIQPDRMFEVLGDATTHVIFTRLDEKTGTLRLRAGNRLGRSRVKFVATSGRNRAESVIDIEVRSANPPSTRLQTHLLGAGESWTARIAPHGLPGTNQVSLEVSALPPLNLENRLRYLIQYPHGCLEQTTSSVFPQLFLSSLVKLEGSRQRQIEDNVRAGIDHMRFFQLANGGFSYWPGGSGGFATGSLEGYALWATTYASHFLVEAEKRGYTVPASMRAGMIRNLRSTAQAWNANRDATMDQAYRLFVLARAGQPEVGAMNRLREQKDIDPVARWVLASAYQLAGLGEAAKALSTGEPLAVRDYRRGDYTFGSNLRDHALVLQSLVVMGQLDRAQPLVKAISDEVGGESWYSTQSVAYSLLAMSQLAGARATGSFTFEQTLGGKVLAQTVTAAVHQATLAGVPDAGQDLTLRNTSSGPLFVTVAVRGTPAPQAEQAGASGLSMQVRYTDAEGEPVELAKLEQGSDLLVEVDVRNGTGVAIDNIALTQILPSGWEIHNGRLADEEAGTGEREEQPSNRFDGTRANTAPRADFVDIRDDRVLQYFSLRAGESIHFQTRVNAAYRGRYYLPGVLAEAMYDASKQAHTAGQWTEIVAQ
jgi:alpha-2-macroglobulin